MSEIAERAHSCIGSLYQFFPNKTSVAEALRDEYVKEIEPSWTALGREAPELSAAELTSRLVALQIQIVKSHPVLIALLDVPPASYTRRRLIRARIAEVLNAYKPRMPKISALRIASVVQQVTRGLLTLYAQTDPSQRAALLQEFKSVLTLYLLSRLESNSRIRRRAID